MKRQPYSTGLLVLGVGLMMFWLAPSWLHGTVEVDAEATTSPVNKTAPAFSGGLWLNTPDGAPISLAARRGKVTIVHFWTFSCINCKHNLPSYAKWAKEFAAQDVLVIGVHTPETDYERDPKNVAQAVRELGITYPVLLDRAGENWHRWHQQYWPTVYLIDKAGRVRYGWEGELEYNGSAGTAKLTRMVRQLLREKTGQTSEIAFKPQATVINFESTQGKEAKMTKITKTDEEWRKELTPEQFEVARKHGTERAFTGEYVNNHDKGMYKCVCCGQELFSSDTKFDSGTGWPSFYQPVDQEDVETKTDSSYGMRRTEALCSRCSAHLGHVFDDGPNPTGLRYCINSAALKFDKEE